MKYTGDAILKGSLTVLSNKPLDNRLVVNTYSDLSGISNTYKYEGMPVICADNGDIWVWTLQGWVKGTSSGSGKSAYDLYVESLPSGLTPLTLSLWLLSLKGELGERGEQGERGKSVYDIYLDTVPEGLTPMTEEEWILSISSTIDISVLVDYATKLYVDLMILENCCHVKHVFLTQEEYDNLEVKDENTLYFIKEDNNTTNGWVFGDNFPIILGGESNNETWKFGDNFPIILTN